MKKTKILSFVMSLVMVMSVLVSLLTVNVSAAQPEAPDMTTLPDGGIILRTHEWFKWSDRGIKSGSNAVIEDGYYKIAVAGGQAWSGYTGDVNTSVWRGASGVMFYVDASETNGKVDFFTEFLIGESRVRGSDNANSYVQLMNYTYDTKEATTAYFYDTTTSQWKAFGKSAEAGTDTRYSVSADGTGWYYLPFTSVYYQGGGGVMHTDDVAKGLNFTEFMERFEGGCYLKQLSIRSQQVGLKFGNVHFVYENMSDTSETATEALFGGNWTAEATEGSGAETHDSNGNFTITGLLGNSTTDSSSRVWLGGSVRTKLIDAAAKKKAVGIKFYVDTTALGDAQLRLRIRLFFSQADTEGKLSEGVFGAKSLGYATTQADGWDQYVMRVGGAAYYYDANGVAQPLYQLAGSEDSEYPGRADKCAEGDILDALPAGYKGYIYIPMDSFGYSISDYNSKIILPWDWVAERYPEIRRIGICGAYEGTAAADAVVYSDFQLVYSQLSDITFKVEGQEDVTVQTTAGATPVFPNATPTKAEDDSYVYEFAGWMATDNSMGLKPSTGDATYTAVFTAIPKYKITFVVEGKETQVVVKQGETPKYPGLPIKAEDDENTYKFDSWDKEIVAAAGDTTYTAVFKAVSKTSETTDTTAPETAAPETETGASEEKGGCGSSLGISAVAMLIVATGSAVVIKRKTY